MAALACFPSPESAMHRGAAAALVGGLTVAALVAFAAGWRGLGSGGMAALAQVLVGVAMLAQAWLSRERTHLLVTAAFLAPACFIVSALAVAPGTEAGLWVLWRAAVAVGALAAVSVPARRLDEAAATRLAWRVAAGSGLSALVALAPVARVVALPAPAVALVLLLTLAAELLAVWRLGLQGEVGIWAAASLVAGALDLALGLVAAHRIGWMLEGIAGLVAACCLSAGLAAQAARLLRQNGELRRMLCTDALTGLYNRRAFDLVFDREWRRSAREETALSLLMIDIDGFKAFNDRHGHPAGDSCLRAVAGVLAAGVHRPADLVARIGGEEFAVLLPVTEEGGAALLAERLRAAVAAAAVACGGRQLGATVSVGVATMWPGPGRPMMTLMEAADQALYRAKRGGRNRVCVEAAGTARRWREVAA